MLEIKPPQRLLLGPGPSNVNYRVLRAMSTPCIGHLDPEFIEVMDEVCRLLRQTFLTANQMTFPVSGTGSAGMEAAFVNVLEPGDTAVIGVNGVFGGRMADLAGRCGARVVKVEADWGQPLDQQAMLEAVRANPGAKLCAIVHAETSTGVLQPIAELGRALQDTDTLFVVDAVTSLGGVELRVDDWGVDVCYSGTQKCLSVPPGLAPVTFGPRAVAAMEARETPVQSWYLDLSMLRNYWAGDGKRMYHHTAPVNMIFGLAEGLRLLHEDGLENRWRTHEAVRGYLAGKLAEMGFGFFAAEGHRLPPLSAVTPPAGWDVEGVRAELLRDYDIEVGAGLGPGAGKVWRIGLMGENACVQKVNVLMGALADFA